MKKANLFVVGAQKSGTSSLHYYLKHVRAINMSDAKETFFFTQNNWQDFDSYHQYYQNTDSAKYYGESSTAYTMQPAYPNIAPRLYEYNRQAKLIYIVRDPVERAISNYWWNVQLCQETRPPLQAIKSNLQYQQTGDYAFQIRPYLDLFDQNQLKFVLFEDLKQSPQQIISQICDWLEIDYDIHTQDIFSVVRRKTAQNIEQIDTATLMGKLRASKVWQNYLRNFVPDNVRQIGRPLATQTLDKNSPKMLTEIEQVRDYLRPLMKPKVEQFKQIASLDFSKWTSLI